ncbi:SDR family NAD(P)-dependent oxidoreductase [Paenibacillus enshidis]|uniref:SDR family NAD(P)-dependent oxidoreductase n=1 Tax=Paenibacillus enshidis TaxID=1458439 RepID=A0ABV5ANJ3_9BACL
MIDQQIPIEGGDHVWIVSRSRPETLQLDDGVNRYWIKADLASVEAGNKIADAFNDTALDVLIYNVGIWESSGFREDYDFEQDDPAEIANILNVNVVSAITCIQRLLPNLKKSDNAKIILIGSTAGLENNHFTQVSFAASKFGLRGIGNSLREHVKLAKDVPSPTMYKVDLERLCNVTLRTMKYITGTNRSRIVHHQSATGWSDVLAVMLCRWQ